MTQVQKVTNIRNIRKRIPTLLLSMFKPMLGAAMGNMGENFHFFTLIDEDETGTRVIDPYRSGILKFNFAKRDGEQLKTQIEFPLNELFVPRKCPNGKDAHISWKYCPWTGKLLEK